MPHDLKTIAQKAGIIYEGEERSIVGLSGLQKAQQADLSFFHPVQAQTEAIITKAGACFIQEGDKDRLPKITIPLISPNPKLSFLRAARLFQTQNSRHSGIHPTAQVSDSAHVDITASIGPYVVVEEGAMIGPDCIIESMSVIGRGVRIEKGCYIGAHVTLSHAFLGPHVVVGSGTRVGQQGFGFMLDGHEFLDMPHLGKVHIHENVHIGANCTIDRGTFSDTVIHAHARVDNLVQIAHNVSIGSHAVIVAQCGIAGSSQIGPGCMLGGQVGVSDHVVLEAQTMVAAQAGIMRCTKKGERLGGSPAVPIQQWHRQNIFLSKAAQPRKRENDI